MFSILKSRNSSLAKVDDDDCVILAIRFPSPLLLFTGMLRLSF